MEYFEELLNRPAPKGPLNIQPACHDLLIVCTVPTKEEIRKAITQLKNGKAAGPYDIHPSRGTKGGHRYICGDALPALHDDLGEKRGADRMEEGISHQASKKGDLSLCSNYRGITLLSIPGKVFNRVLLNRLKDAVDPHLRDHQARFRKNRSCADQIVSLRIILEQSLEWNPIL